MNVLVILGSLGGITTAIAAVWVIVRAIFRQVSATEDNTRALTQLTARVDQLGQTQAQHGERLARLEGGRRS